MTILFNLRRLVAGVLVLLAIGTVGAFDAQDQQMEHERFCQMVSDGYWPNYKGVDCDDILEK